MKPSSPSCSPQTLQTQRIPSKPDPRSRERLCKENEKRGSALPRNVITMVVVIMMMMMMIVITTMTILVMVLVIEMVLPARVRFDADSQEEE